MVDAHEHTLVVDPKETDAVAVVTELPGLRLGGAGFKERTLGNALGFECRRIAEKRIAPANDDIRAIARRNINPIVRTAHDGLETQRRQRRLRPDGIARK